jgi:hypothetical protein
MFDVGDNFLQDRHGRAVQYVVNVTLGLECAERGSLIVELAQSLQNGRGCAVPVEHPKGKLEGLLERLRSFGGHLVSSETGMSAKFYSTIRACGRNLEERWTQEIPL